MTDSTPQSSSAVGENPADRRKSFGKYVKRLSSVLRRGSSKSSIPQIATPTTPGPAEPTTEPSVPTNKTEEAPAQSGPAPATEPAAATPAPAAPTSAQNPAAEEPIPITTSAGSSSVPGAYARSAVQQERARALFAKYGLTLEAHEWITQSPTPSNVQRVEKPIRMRVHRMCHRCNNTFGADRVCTKCEHKRCKKCPRYPTKKPKDSAAPKEVKGKENEPPKDEEALAKRKKKNQLSLKTKAGGEVVYQPVRQRIRRSCHKCDTLFTPPTASVCESCEHIRCTKCPRDPAKFKKWPDGYPGDMPYEASDDEPARPDRPERSYRKTKLRVKWTCHECSAQFVEGSKQCEECKHERCEKCTRTPPKKEKPEFDPEVVKRVEDKLKALTVQPPPAPL